MPHVEVIQNGVIIVKPDPRLKRALSGSLQFLGRLGRVVPGVRSLIRHELILRWLHRELDEFAHKSKYRGKKIYIALDEHLLGGAKDLTALVRDNSRSFLSMEQLESGIRTAFSLIASSKIRTEWHRKAKKRVQTYGEARQRRAR